jgi:hypothetical protein
MGCGVGAGVLVVFSSEVRLSFDCFNQFVVVDTAALPNFGAPCRSLWSVQLQWISTVVFCAQRPLFCQ